MGLLASRSELVCGFPHRFVKQGIVLGLWIAHRMTRLRTLPGYTIKFLNTLNMPEVVTYVHFIVDREFASRGGFRG